MLRRRTAKLAFALVILLVVGAALSLKYFAWLDSMAPPVDAEGKISEVLVAAGFAPGEWGGDPRTVSSVAGDCDLYVMLPSYGGDHQDFIQQTSVGYDLVFYFGGKAFEAQPGLQTRFHYYWIRFLAALGLSEERSLLLAVVANPICQNVPLEQLRQLTE
ncbi:MAG: hypothetical protein ABL866_13040 [Devosia sp.]